MPLSKNVTTECTGASAKENKAEAQVIKLDFMSFRLRWKVSVDREFFFLKKTWASYNEMHFKWQTIQWCSWRLKSEDLLQYTTTYTNMY